MPDLHQGDAITYFGDFVLFGEVGRGSTGTVYRARQKNTKRTVALKLLHALPFEVGLPRVQIEVEAVARLDHRSIVKILETGKHDGRTFLTMPFVEGESLAALIERHGSIPERDAALLMLKIVEAVHHAHQRMVIHRDLKPGNILIDEVGEPHLIDFGLAKFSEKDSGLTQTGIFIGTPLYASPEQLAGDTKYLTTGSDIFSLGAIFYAMLVGFPPFIGKSPPEIQAAQKKSARPDFRSLRHTLSKDIKTICAKSLELEPARRYASASEMAEDLKRFLDRRPIAARPIGAFERLWMWARRNPAQAALWGMAILLVLTPPVFISVWRNSQAKAAEAQNHLLQRDLVLQENQATRLTEHSAGWSEHARSRAIEAAKVSTPGDSGGLRDQVAALLAGLDAHRIKYYTNFGANGVAFDSGGERLLMDTVGDHVKLLDSTSGNLRTFPESGVGPVGFSPNGTPIQLLCDTNRHSLVVLNLADTNVMREWSIPEQFEAASLNLEVHPILAAQASAAVVSLNRSNGPTGLLAFLPEEVRMLEGLTASVTAIAISPEGSLVAAAESTGQIKVWSVRDGVRPILELYSTRVEIKSLALKRTPRISESRETSTNGVWLLAAGDSGGLVTIWNLRTRTISAHCRGGHYHVYALAFGPDGTILASGGRGPVKLWDVATGRLLLDVPSGDYISGLDFTPNGAQLAVSSQGVFAPANVSIWDLEYGRGISTLHGLSGQVSKICFSADGREMAALSHGWEVGVWSLTTGELLKILDVPKGDWADNAALALSPDGERLAYSALQTAKVWDLKSGAELASRSLPPGFVDVIGFADKDSPLLFRVETLDGAVRPFGTDPRKHPRVCRIRNLLAPEKNAGIAENGDFNWHVFNVASAADGQCFVVEGLQVTGNEGRMQVGCVDALTGKAKWKVSSTRKNGSGIIAIDPTGSFLAVQTNSSPEAVLIETSSGAITKSLPWLPAAFAVVAKLYVRAGSASSADRGYSLFDGVQAAPLVALGIDNAPSNSVQFDRDGSRLAWGNTDGSVTVCNLHEMHDRLSSMGLQW